MPLSFDVRNRKPDPRIEANRKKVQRAQDMQVAEFGSGLSVKQAAAAAGVSRSTIYRWIHKGKLNGFYRAKSKAGGRVRFWVPLKSLPRLKAYRASDADLR